MLHQLLSTLSTCKSIEMCPGSAVIPKPSGLPERNREIRMAAAVEVSMMAWQKPLCLYGVFLDISLSTSLSLALSSNLSMSTTFYPPSSAWVELYPWNAVYFDPTSTPKGTWEKYFTYTSARFVSTVNWEKRVIQLQGENSIHNILTGQKMRITVHMKVAWHHAWLH